MGGTFFTSWKRLSLGTLCAMSLLALSVQAQTFTNWTGSAGDGLWTSGGNWSNGVPDATTEIAVFRASAFSGNQTVTVPSGTITVGGIQYGSSDNVTINGPGSLTIENSFGGQTHTIVFVTDFYGSGGTFTMNASVAASNAPNYIANTSTSGTSVIINGTQVSNGQRVVPSSSGAITINSDVSGTGGIYLERSSTSTIPVILTSATTYTGQTEWVRGILRATADATFGNGTGDINQAFAFGANNATLELRDLNTTTIPNSYTFRGTGFSDAGSLHLASGTATLTGGGTFHDANDPQVKLATDSGTTLTLTGSSNISGELLIEANGDVETSGSGRFTGGSGSLVKTGSGTLTQGGGNNTYSGATTINEGSLVMNSSSNSVGGSDLILNSGTSASMSQSDQLGASTKLTLNDATFNTNGFDDTLGAFILQNSSSLDLGDGDSVLVFADSSGETWTGAQTLLLLKWTGDLSGGGIDQVFFGSDTSGLTGSQLGQLTFRDPAGLAAGDYGAQILGTGEVVPVPEPSTYGAILGLAALAYIVYRRKKTA